MTRPLLALAVLLVAVIACTLTPVTVTHGTNGVKDDLFMPYELNVTEIVTSSPQTVTTPAHQATIRKQPTPVPAVTGQRTK